ncbi:MAG: hypothetical protein FK733_10290 [Asgard group archaeon]|nr:hypothetical protein [Asgard group archaeon]
MPRPDDWDDKSCAWKCWYCRFRFVEVCCCGCCEDPEDCIGTEPPNFLSRKELTDMRIKNTKWFLLRLFRRK